MKKLIIVLSLLFGLIGTNCKSQVTRVKQVGIPTTVTQILAIPGDTLLLPSVVVAGTSITIQILYQDLDASDGSVEFFQSSNNIDFDPIQGGLVITLDKNKTSHTVNIVGLNNDNIRLLIRPNSVTSGNITEIRYTFRP